MLLLVIGMLALARSFDVPLPEWLLSWQMLLIGIGLIIGIRKNFQGGWFVPVLIGGVFMANEFFLHGEIRRHIWPLILIILGLFFVFRPRRRRFCDWDQKKNSVSEPDAIASEVDPNEDDFIDSTSIFGSAKKVILSKKFRGGDIVNIFGGTEIDLTQADMTGSAVIDITALFGGATLIVPSHWMVRSEAVTIFGGITDKRKFTNYTDTAVKTILLKGTIIFGGIEVKSY